MKLGEFIKKYRETHKLSQREFAMTCGVSNTYITYLEKGIGKDGKRLTPTVSKLKAIAEGMNITVQELLNSVDDL